MKHYLQSSNSNNLLIFFSGWGCDEYEFHHLKSDSDVLILYDYSDLNLDFDFSKYKKCDLMAFSAGVFIASVMNFDFKIDKKVAIDGNPFLFDEYYGLSAKIQDVLCNITEENADEFAQSYLIKTEEEKEKFHHSMRTLKSCQEEFDSLRKIYEEQKQNIRNIYDIALIGDSDTIFDISAQKEFYKNKLHIVKAARHNPFFKIQKYEDLLTIALKF